MMKRYILISALIFAIFIGEARTAVSYGTVSAANPVLFSMGQKISEGVALLKRSPALKYEMKKKPASQLYRKQIAVAVLNINTGELMEKRVWVNMDDINKYPKNGAVIFVPDEAGEPFNIQPKLWNSFNSYIEIVGRSELVVVANKYLLESKTLGKLPERSSKKYSEIIYSPYSDKLATSDIVETGRVYLNNNVRKAFEELRSKKIASRTNKNILATNIVTEDFIKNIILTEHIDPDSFDLASDGGKNLSERVLAIIGANQKNAYRYTGSPAGATGLAQFISSTYAKIYANYPEAKLIKDYSLGMADHVNAIKAMVLFFDLHESEIISKISRKDVANQLGITEEMLAAAYNGGPNRVIKAVNNLGSSWLTAQITLPVIKKNFRQETLNYLEKYISIKNLGLF